MLFHYIASQPDGRIIENDVEANDVGQVLTFLSSQGFKPVSVKAVSKATQTGRKEIFGSKISLTDQVFISKYLALMLKIGTGLLQAINILIDDFSKPAVRGFLLEVRSNLEKGQPFFAAFARYPKTFSQVYINSVKAGEAAGNLEYIFENLSASLTKEKALRDQVKGALFYPIILLGASVLILIFLVVFALPKIAKVFTESGFEPPLFSKIVFAIGLFLGKFGIYVIAGLIILVAIVVVLYKTSLAFKKMMVGIFSGLPLVRDVTKKMAIQRFAATLSTLIKAGMPLTDALEITSDSITQFQLKEALVRISRDGLAKGLTVGEAFKREPYFPKTVVNLIAISEKAGHIEEVLATLADFYAAEVEGSLKMLVAFLEPIMLLSIGLIIGVIALAIVVPIYQLTVQF
ncbi:MAG: type II secretion system F family protein [Patescibacteria group bacterium]